MLIAKIILSLALSQADKLSDLERYAKEVPVDKVSADAIRYIQNETNESVKGLASHYTLALFEDKETNETWYLVDGYYELKSGAILMLDFVYEPLTKTFFPIKNYKKNVPVATERFMMKSKAICSPEKRNQLGILQIAKTDELSVDRLRFYLKAKLNKNFTLVDTPISVFVVDSTRNTKWSPFDETMYEPAFTLSEDALVKSLKEDINLDAQILDMSGGRHDPTLEVTYAAVTDSCRK